MTDHMLQKAPGPYGFVSKTQDVLLILKVMWVRVAIAVI